MSLRLRWWFWALVNWALLLVIFIVIAAVFHSKSWDLQPDHLNVGTLTPKQCNDQLFMQSMPLARRRPDQCEAPQLKNVVVEPQNTWSNYGYLLAGLLILYRRPRLLGTAVGVNFCLMFLSSAWYHATLLPIPQAFDVSWIYALILSLIAFAIEALVERYGNRSFRYALSIPLAATPVVVGIVATILKVNRIYPDSTTVTAVLLSILAIPITIVMFDFWWLDPNDWLVWRWHWDAWVWPFTRITGALKQFRENLSGREFLGVNRWQFLIYIALSGGMGIFFRLNDGCGHSLCRPSAIIQAHAVWHVMGAVALWWTYDLLAQAANSARDTMLWL